MENGESKRPANVLRVMLVCVCVCRRPQRGETVRWWQQSCGQAVVAVTVVLLSVDRPKKATAAERVSERCAEKLVGSAWMGVWVGGKATHLREGTCRHCPTCEWLRYLPCSPNLLAPNRQGGTSGPSRSANTVLAARSYQVYVSSTRKASDRGVPLSMGQLLTHH